MPTCGTISDDPLFVYTSLFVQIMNQYISEECCSMKAKFKMQCYFADYKKTIEYHEGKSKYGSSGLP